MTQLPVEYNDYAITTGKAQEDPKAIEKVSGSGFLPYVQVAGSSSKLVKQRKVGMGHYALIKGKTPIDLGETFSAWVIQWRSRAMCIDNDGMRSFYNYKHPEFQKIQAIVDASTPDSQCMYGPEVLLWIFDQSTFAGFFFSSKTARNEYANLHPMMGKPVTFGIQFIETKKYSWHGPTVAACQSPGTNLPDKEEFQMVLNRFNNPPDSVIETVEADERPQ